MGRKMINLTKQQFIICKNLMETGDDLPIIASRLGLKLSTVRMHLNHARVKIACQLDKPINSTLQLTLTLIREGFTNGTDTILPFNNQSTMGGVQEPQGHCETLTDED